MIDIPLSHLCGTLRPVCLTFHPLSIMPLSEEKHFGCLSIPMAVVEVAMAAEVAVAEVEVISGGGGGGGAQG